MKRVLGGNVRIIGSGAAPLRPDALHSCVLFFVVVFVKIVALLKQHLLRVCNV